MRKLIWLCLIFVVLYSGYWLIAARATENGIATWLSARHAEGWQTEYATLETHGYPLSFATTLTDIAVADPATGVLYQTPRLDIQSRSFTPTRLHANLAQNIQLSTPYQSIDITSKTAGVTLFVDAGPALTLNHAAYDFTQVTAASTLGWGFSLANATAVAARNEDTPLAHDISIKINDLSPSAAMIAQLDSNGILSDTFDVLNIETTITFDKSWDITALEGPRPQPTHIDLRNAAATWGALDLQLAGSFDVDARGYPNGTLQIKATNWREMITLATAAGLIPRNIESMALKAGELLAGLKGNPSTINAELTMSRGTISLGFLPLGPAPRLVIR